MVKCAYVGKRFIPRNVGDVDYESCFVDDEFGEPNYPEIVGSRGYG